MRPDDRRCGTPSSRRADASGAHRLHMVRLVLPSGTTDDVSDVSDVLEVATAWSVRTLPAA